MGPVLSTTQLVPVLLTVLSDAITQSTEKDGPTEVVARKIYTIGRAANTCLGNSEGGDACVAKPGPANILMTVNPKIIVPGHKTTVVVTASGEAYTIGSESSNQASVNDFKLTRVLPGIVVTHVWQSSLR